MMWRERAATAIFNALKSIGDDAPVKEKIAAIDAAYPFGQRRFHPYKIWLSERKTALSRLGVVTAKKNSTLPLFSPLEKAKMKALAHESASK